MAVPIQLLEYQILWDGGLINKLTPPAAAVQQVYYCGNRNGSESLCGWFQLVTEIDVGADVMAKVESNVLVFVYFYFLYLCFCICVLACDRD